MQLCSSGALALFAGLLLKNYQQWNNVVMLDITKLKKLFWITQENIFRVIEDEL